MNREKFWFAKSFDQKTAVSIVDRASILLARMLPGCTPRRISLAKRLGPMPIFNCFVNSGPILLQLDFSPDKYYSAVYPKLIYMMMLREMKFPGILFEGPDVPTRVTLESGPEEMAKEVFEAMSKVDLAEAIAAATPEHYLSAQSRVPAPFPHFDLALCAIHLGRDREAHDLLRECVRLAKADGRMPYRWVITLAQKYLKTLEVDADGLRSELIAIMQSNWFRLKIVDASNHWFIAVLTAVVRQRRAFAVRPRVRREARSSDGGRWPAGLRRS